MAGDWIKVRDDLIDDPSVAKIATALSLDRYGVVGRLIAIWIWADRHTPDGHADVALQFLDDHVSTPGMADAMVLARWLEVPENGHIRFPKFDRHNGKSAKKRALNTKRKQTERSRAPVALSSRKRRMDSVTREEKSSTNKYLPVINHTARPQPTQNPQGNSTPNPTTQPADPDIPGGSPLALYELATGTRLRPKPETESLDD